MIQARRADIDHGFFFIAAEAIEVAAIRLQRLAVDVGKSIVWNIVLMLQQVAKRDLCRRTEAESD